MEKPAAPVEVKAAEPVEAATFLKDPMIEAAMELFDASLES